MAVFVTGQALITVRKDDRFDLAPVLARWDGSSDLAGHGRTAFAPTARRGQVAIVGALARRGCELPSLALWGNKCCTVASTRSLRVLTEWDETPGQRSCVVVIAGRSEQCRYAGTTM